MVDAILEGGKAIVARVELHDGDLVDPPMIDVTLMPGVTGAQAREFVCQVVRPAIASLGAANRPGVDVWDAGMKTVIVTESSC